MVKSMTASLVSFLYFPCIAIFALSYIQRLIRESAHSEFMYCAKMIIFNITAEGVKHNIIRCRC
jgi:hypothetical protein